jgi:hypothetical protein
MIDQQSHVMSSDSSINLDHAVQDGPDKVLQELPDFDAVRLKLGTLANEKEFLLNENTVIKKRLDMVRNCPNVKMNQKLDTATKSLKESKNQLRDLNELKREYLEKMTLLDQRYSRAKKVAAHIEKQFKESKPNTKIDYVMIGNPEPTTQLLAAILAKVRCI